MARERQGAHGDDNVLRTSSAHLVPSLWSGQSVCTELKLRALDRPFPIATKRNAGADRDRAMARMTMMIAIMCTTRRDASSSTSFSDVSQNRSSSLKYDKGLETTRLASASASGRHQGGRDSAACVLGAHRAASRRGHKRLRGCTHDGTKEERREEGQEEVERRGTATGGALWCECMPFRARAPECCLALTLMPELVHWICMCA